MSQDKILEKIQSLLNLAEHEGTGAEEADAARKMADKMMIKFAIDEHALAKAGKNVKSYKPVVEVFEFCEPYSKKGNPLLQEYYDLLFSIAKHNRARVHGKWDGKATIVGYESDVWITKIMYTQVRLHMASKINPQPDTGSTFDENVYNLHEAGLIWSEICNRMNAVAGIGDWGPTPWPDGGRLVRAAKRQAKVEGTEYQARMQPHIYRKSFAEGYASEIRIRLYDMAQGSAQERKEGELVLVERKEAVDDIFNEMFPPVQYKASRARKYREQKRDASATAAGRQAGKEADLGASGGRVSNDNSRKELA